MRPVALRRDGVLGAAGVVGAAAYWWLYVGLCLAVLASVVADGSPPSRDELLLAAVASFAVFWLVSAYTWVAIAAARLLVALRRAR